MREKISRAVLLLAILGFGVLWYFEPTYSADVLKNRLLRDLVQRSVGSAIFLALTFYLGYRVWNKPATRAWLVILPCLLVVVNNIPFIALLTDRAVIHRPEYLWLFLLDCLMIGVFEEVAFRGTIFLAILEKRRKSTKQIFWTTAASSAIFGLIHLANLLDGANPGATILQVGYSFLIGGMCAIVLLKSHNLGFCILLHAVFDVGGRMVGTIATGKIWNLPTIILTAILGVAVMVWMIYVLLHIRPEETDAFYPLKKESEDAAN